MQYCRDYLSVVLSGDKSGRLMKYDTASKQVTALLKNLTFPNGVALSKDGSFVLLAETTSCRILRYWIKTSKAGALEVFAQLQGFPDNIKRSPRGGYWVGINSKREKLSELLFSYPWIGKVLLKLPLDITKVQTALAKYRGGGLAVRLSENGDIVEVFEDRDGNRLKSISEVMEKDGKLWIGSIDLPFAGRYKI
jgi:sugar lactone lactonase YvrE